MFTACNLLWRRRPAGGFSDGASRKTAGETPAPQKPAFLCALPARRYADRHPTGNAY
jgi:hypothetical protein